MLPKFLIIGAMRCGTTVMSRLVNAHPGVFIPSRKEMHYFDVGMDKGLRWYEGYFDEVASGVMPGEATPGYLYHPGTAERIFDVIPEARLVAILRNPIDRAYSHYWHNERRGREQRPFAQAVADEKAGVFPGPAGGRNYYAYLGRGHYVEQLKTYEALFPRDRMLVLLNRDLRRDRDGTLEKVWNHIGVGAPSRSVDDLLAAKPKPPLHRRLRRMVSGKKGAGSDRFEYPPMDQAIRAELLEYFEPDVAAAEEWLGQSLDHWRS